MADIAAGYTAIKIIEKIPIDQIKKFANKFKNKEINFIGDEKTIEDVNKTRTTTEFNFYINYIKDNELKILLRCGIILKRYEDKGEDLKLKLQNLREKLLRKSKDSLWFAQLVQNGLLREYISLLISEDYTVSEIEKKIKRIHEKIDKFTYFVKEIENDELIKKQIFELLSGKPEIFLISSKGKASLNLKRIKTSIMNQYEESYKYKIVEDEHKLLMFFLLKVDKA